MNKNIPEYIVIEGPIGVGKTSLARRLADTFNSDLMLEASSDNPFLPDFYKNPRATALPTQLHFLFQRVKQMETLRQKDLFRSTHIADFLPEKDRLFARVTLNDNEYELYRQVYDRMVSDIPVPDLVIYLQAPPDVLLQRIHERGIEYEKHIPADYLKQITDAYVDFFYHYDLSPLIINTADFDLVNGLRNFDMLVEYIGKLTTGRHYLNPKEL
jgi:deoxyguanosine kinase